MICPACGQRASTLQRYLFSRQGVTFAQNARGYLTCQSCGALLHVAGFRSSFWWQFAATVGFLAAFAALFSVLMDAFGPDMMVALWLGLVVVITTGFAVGLWKYAILVPVEGPSPEDSSPVP